MSGSQWRASFAYKQIFIALPPRRLNTETKEEVAIKIIDLEEACVSVAVILIHIKARRLFVPSQSTSMTVLSFTHFHNAARTS